MPKNAMSQREASTPAIDAEIAPGLAPEAAKTFVGVDAGEELEIALAARGISKQGEPSRPTFSRTGPSIGAITLVA